MRDDIETRVIREARYILATNSTVRATAKLFKVGKSTVHKDVAKRLKSIDKQLYEEIRKVLDLNLLQRHIRGGQATKLKYQDKKEG